MHEAPPSTLAKALEMFKWQSGCIFHWGMSLSCRVCRDGSYDWKVFGANYTVMDEGNFKGTWLQACLYTISKGHHAAISSRNGGKFNYQPGVTTFDEFLADAERHVIGLESEFSRFPFHDPDEIWFRYRVAMMAKYKTGQNTIPPEPSLLKPRKN